MKKEGLSGLSDEELFDACVERSLKTEGLQRDEMEKSLKRWIEMSVLDEMPPSFLIFYSIMNEKEKL